jgi:uncharacterized coiled-coil protein SlyX
MFYYKKFQELKSRVDEIEKRVHELAHKFHEQAKEIDHLYALLVNQKPAVVEKPATESKTKRYRTRKKNGKENTETSK